MAARLVIAALAAIICGTAFAAPAILTNSGADTADQQLKARLPDFHLGPGDMGRLTRRQDYTYNWTGVDNHLDFRPTQNGYSVTFKWDAPDPNTVGDFAVGRGWSKGTNRTITFSGSTNTSSTEGVVSVSVYGWANTKPPVEYWIREYTSKPEYAPSGTKVGSLDSDGGTYDIYRYLVVPPPSGSSDIDTRTWWQYVSVRRPGTQRPAGGTVTTANHFNAWKAKGLLQLDNFDWQIVATEGYKAAGSSAYTVVGS